MGCGATHAASLAGGLELGVALGPDREGALGEGTTAGPRDRGGQAIRGRGPRGLAAGPRRRVGSALDVPPGRERSGVRSDRWTRSAAILDMTEGVAMGRRPDRGR